MQNADQLRLRKRIAGSRVRPRIADFEVLVALGQDIEVKSLGRIGEKNLRLHFRVDRLGVDIGEGNAENERTQVIDIRDAAERPKPALGKKVCVLAALILPRGADATDAAIHHSYIIEEQIRGVARASAEFRALRPTALRI